MLDLDLMINIRSLQYYRKFIFYVIKGAAIANHVKVIDLVKKEGKIVGAKMRDELTGEEWITKAKCVV